MKEPMTPDDLWRTLRTRISLPFPPQELSHYIRNAEYDVQLYEDCIDRLRERQAVPRRNIARYSSFIPHSKTPHRDSPTRLCLRMCHRPLGQNIPWVGCPFHLSGVCARWREITLNSPELWTNISLDLAEQTRYPATLIIERSKQHLLSLRLNGGWDEDTFDATEDIFGLFTEHASRWREMDFSELGTVAFGAFTAAETPQLETVAFSPLQTEIIFPELSHAPRLRIVKYGDGIEEGSLDDVPWNGVDQLELAFDNTRTPSSVFKALRLGYNLKSLVYYGEANVGWVNQTLYERNEGGPQPVSSNLETLSVRLGCAGGFYNLLHDFIRSLKLPFLDNLAVSFLEPSDVKDREVLTFGTTSWPRDVFIQFMERSERRDVARVSQNR
ncbi:hypothetical protein PM082_011252 [Marasmius tenuissimus]|nr:hypothetical protein PM082_011252 [Marasmius tenuissimus]